MNGSTGELLNPSTTILIPPHRIRRRQTNLRNTQTLPQRQNVTIHTETITTVRNDHAMLETLQRTATGHQLRTGNRPPQKPGLKTLSHILTTDWARHHSKNFGTILIMQRSILKILSPSTAIFTKPLRVGNRQLIPTNLSSLTKPCCTDFPPCRVCSSRSGPIHSALFVHTPASRRSLTYNIARRLPQILSIFRPNGINQFRGGRPIIAERVQIHTTIDTVNRTTRRVLPATVIG